MDAYEVKTTKSTEDSRALRSNLFLGRGNLN